MRHKSLIAIVAPICMALGGCSSSGGGTTPVTVTVLGYTVVITTAPPATALVGASVPIAFSVKENESDGTSKPASGRSFTVTVTAGAGTVNGGTTAALTTAADGSVSLTWILGPAAGSQTLRGAVSSTQFVDVSTTATLPPVSTVAVTITTPSIAMGTIGDQASAVVKDASGNVLQGRLVTWQSSNTTVATVNATGVISAVGVGTSTISATSETKSGSALLTVTQSTWNAAWHLRKQVAVTTTTASAPTGYSVAVQLDHASLVAAGKSLASGNDVRMLYWTGSNWIELDRVLDAGSAWNSATTTIWFQTQAAINAASSDNNYYIYYNNAAAPAPPAGKSNVFLFADDFEAGNLNKWTTLLGLWTVDNSRSHTGTFSLKYPTEGDVDGLTRMLVANPAVNVADIYVESWWFMNSAATDYNLAQGMRMTGVQPTSNGYYTKLYNSSTFGWANGKVINGTFFELTAPVGPLLSNSWIRVGTAMAGTTMRTLVNGVDIGSIGGLTELTSGNIAFRKFVVPVGASWWIDDVIARRYVTPEPTAAAGSEGAAP
jgi:hypothetical protein